MKVVIDKGSVYFGLSDKAIRLLASKKSITLYPEEQESSGVYEYFLVPEDKRIPDIDCGKATRDEEEAYYTAFMATVFQWCDIPRNDPDLVAVVEGLGKEANDTWSILRVIDVPDGEQWQVDTVEDRYEILVEPHRIWG